MILQNKRNSSDSGIMLGLVLGDGKRGYSKSTSSLSRGVQRISSQIKHLERAQTLWVWRHGPCNKERRPWSFFSRREKLNWNLYTWNPDNRESTPRDLYWKIGWSRLNRGWVAGDCINHSEKGPSFGATYQEKGAWFFGGKRKVRFLREIWWGSPRIIIYTDP